MSITQIRSLNNIQAFAIFFKSLIEFSLDGLQICYVIHDVNSIFTVNLADLF